MSRVFVASPGSHPTKTGQTFVPAGWKVIFYADVNEKELTSNGLAAVVTGGGAGGRETFDASNGPVTIPNYALKGEDDRGMVQYLASVSSVTGGTLYFVGLPTDDPLGGLVSLGQAGQSLLL